MRQLFFVLLTFVLSLFGLVALFNTVTNNSKQSNIALAKALPDYPDAEEHLVKALQWRSSDDSIGQVNIVRFHAWLRQQYPLLFDNPNLEWQEFGASNWVAKWIGRKEDLAPIVWMASPEIATTLNNSTTVLSSKLSKEYIHGKGSRGGKTAMIAMLEVLHRLIEEERLPDRTIYLAFPFPAQVGEERILKTLAQAGTPAEYILQTGGGIAKNTLWGLSEPVALLGVGKLAQARITLIRNNPKTTWTAVVQRLEDNLPCTDLNHSTTKNFLQQISPELPFGQRFIFSNGWLLNWKKSSYFAPASFAKRLISFSTHLIPSSPYSDTAQLCISAPKLSKTALADILASLKMDSIRVASNWTIQQGFATAEIESRPYRLLGNTCKEVFPRVLAAPIWINKAPTASPNIIQAPVFYFHPIQQDSSSWQNEQKEIKEQISRQNYQRMLHFYYQLLNNSI